MAFTINPSETIVLSLTITDATGEKSNTRLRLTPDNALSGVTVGDLTNLVPVVLAQLGGGALNGAISDVKVEIAYNNGVNGLGSSSTFQSVDDKARLKFTTPTTGNTSHLSFATPTAADFKADQEQVDPAGGLSGFITHATQSGFSDVTNLWKMVDEDGGTPLQYVDGYRIWVNRKGGSKPR